MKIEAASASITGVDSALEMVRPLQDGRQFPCPKANAVDLHPGSLTAIICTRMRPRYIWPTPRLAGRLELWIYAVMTQFVNLTDTIDLPQGYEAGLRWNLASVLAPEYGRPIDPIVLAKAQNFKARSCS